jgi:hypothetical protein
VRQRSRQEENTLLRRRRAVAAISGRIKFAAVSTALSSVDFMNRRIGNRTYTVVWEDGGGDSASYPIRCVLLIIGPSN